MLPGHTYLQGRQHTGTGEWGPRWPPHTRVNEKGRLMQTDGERLAVSVVTCISFFVYNPLYPGAHGLRELP